MIKITSKQEGFRRCGIAHGCLETQYKDDFFSDEQLEQLRKEPMLVVDWSENEPPSLNATETIALVKTLSTLDELAAISVNENRKSVLAAITAREKELAPGAES